MNYQKFKDNFRESDLRIEEVLGNMPKDWEAKLQKDNTSLTYDSYGDVEEVFKIYTLGKFNCTVKFIGETDSYGYIEWKNFKEVFEKTKTIIEWN